MCEGCVFMAASASAVQMPRIKSTMKLMDEGEAPEAGGAENVSFEFGLSRVTESELDSFAKRGWLDRGLARATKGEVVPKPEDDEVVVFREFFLAGFCFPAHPLVLGGAEEVQVEVSSV